MITNSRKARLWQAAADQGMFVREYSPGDGVTRYRFFDHEEVTRLGSRPGKQSYFGPANGRYTALGIREAEAFLGL